MIFYCLSVLEFCSYSNEFNYYSHPDILFEAFPALRPVGLTEGEMLVKVLKINNVVNLRSIRCSEKKSIYITVNIDEITLLCYSL